MNKISPQTLKQHLGDGGELALIDVREQGAFSAGHLLFAISLPYSHLELKLADLIPRRSVRLVVCDGGDGEPGKLADRAAERLAGFGYNNVSILEAGVDGWRAARFEVFTGVNVPSKAFGEFVEHAYDTPRLTAEEVKAKMDRGDKMVVLDSRPIEEFRRMSIPTGIDMPGAELVYRVHDMAPDPDTFVLVNCAGRTRSIIGAQSLINAGIPNQVAALKDGTMGWHLAGLTLAKGEDAFADRPSADGLAKGREAADRVAARFGVRTVDRQTVQQWQSETDRRALFLLDVRQPDEFAAGHLPAYRNAPGGQLVQATDEYVGIRHARIVLADDCGIRATMTASWLIQMGWDDVFVLECGVGDAGLEQGSVAPTVLGRQEVEKISPMELKAAIDSGEPLAVVDLASSLQYRAGHIDRAWWAVRSRFDSGLFRIPPVGLIVLTSPDGLLAELAAADAAAARPGVLIRVLAGGTAAWKAAGLPLAEGMNYVTSETDDVWYKPYDHQGSVEQWMREYLTWEVALVDQIARDGDANFRTF